MAIGRREFFKHLTAQGLASVAVTNGLPDLQAESTSGAPRLRASSPGRQLRLRRISLDEYRDRVHGAWLAEIAGTLFGFPFEGQPRNVAPHLDRILRTYSHAPVDDDYYYEMVALYGFEHYGIGMSVEQLGEVWKEHQAGSWGSSAQAQLLLEKGIKAPQTGNPRYNPLFHTIGPQFSSDIYGMITPGMINLAGATARNYSHVNGYAEGSDGAVFIASCISEAFFTTDTARIVHQAANLISPKSNYRKALDQVLEGFSQAKDWRQLAAEVEDRWRPDYPQFNNSVANGALVALALLYGKGNYLNTLDIVTATDDFTDADCNSANIGSILGAMHGAKAVPPNMVEPLHDRIYGNSMGPVTFKATIDERISDLAARTADVGRKLVLANGASEKDGSLFIPEQDVKQQPLEWFDINDYGKLWDSQWSLAHAGRGGYGITYLEWETNTLVTFPRDTRPCRLERDVRLSGGHPSLHLNVGTVPGQPWHIEVRVNDTKILSHDVETEGTGSDAQYLDLHLDLTSYAGQRAKLRLFHWPAAKKPPASAYWRKATLLNT